MGENTIKSNKFQVVASCSVLCSNKIFFLRHITFDTNNKALIQKTSQYLDMTTS